MQALYQVGRPADALAAYGRARMVLAAELGIEPGPALRQIEQAILTHDSRLAGDTATTVPLGISNLPAPVSPLIGRAAELEEVRTLLAEQRVRLLTFCGPGGTGKTRLALAAAEQLAAHSDDGACFVDLAVLDDHQQVLPAIATALDLTGRDRSEHQAAVAGFVRPRQLVLVLDNFEHVLAAWSVVADLLSAAPKLTIFVTSRAPLGISGEQRYDVPPLAVPRTSPLPPLDAVAQVASVELFTARARLVQHRFRLTDDNVRPIAELCRRLDGLPLAVELAAAHARTLTPQRILEEWEHRLSALRAGPRDRPARHQTIAAAIAWSYDTLVPRDRAVFAQLAVFAGAPVVSDVVSICRSDELEYSSVDEALERLADASLINRHVDESGRPRVSMLQPIKDFAQTELAERDKAHELRRRHASHYLTFAESAAAELHGPNQVSAFHRLRAEHAELHHALNWAAGDDGDVEFGLRLVGNLWHYWEITGDVTEPRRAAQACLAQTDAGAPPALLARALSGTATLCWLQGDITEAERLHLAALAAYEADSDHSGIAWTQMCLATQATTRSDYETAERLATEALGAATALADHRTAAFALVILGAIAWYQHDGPRANALQQRALELCRDAGDRWAAAKPLINLADIAEGSAEYDRANVLLIEALETSREMGDHALAIYCVEAIAELRLRAGLSAPAIRLLAACDTYRTEMGLPLEAQERELQDDILAEARLAAGTTKLGLHGPKARRCPSTKRLKKRSAKSTRRASRKPGCHGGEWRRRRSSVRRSKPEIFRCLKRYVAREVYQALPAETPSHFGTDPRMP
jgi:predicted ATPase